MLPEISVNALVSELVPIINTPSAKGSKVPPCPTFLSLVTPRSFLTTSKLVHPTGLYILYIFAINLQIVNREISYLTFEQKLQYRRNKI